MFGGKRGRLASRKTPSQPSSMGVAASCCGGCFAAGTGALHKIDGIMRKGKLCGYIKATSQAIRKLKIGRKWVFQRDNDPKHTSKVVAKWLKDNKVKVLEWPLQSPDLNPIEKLWAALKVCASKEAYKPDLVTPLLSGEMSQNSLNLLWEACGRLLETFDPS